MYAYIIQKASKKKFVFIVCMLFIFSLNIVCICVYVCLCVSVCIHVCVCVVCLCSPGPENCCNVMCDAASWLLFMLFNKVRDQYFCCTRMNDVRIIMHV